MARGKLIPAEWFTFRTPGRSKTFELPRKRMFIAFFLGLALWQVLSSGETVVLHADWKVCDETTGAHCRVKTAQNHVLEFWYYLAPVVPKTAKAALLTVGIYSLCFAVANFLSGFAAVNGGVIGALVVLVVAPLVGELAVFLRASMLGGIYTNGFLAVPVWFLITTAFIVLIKRL